MEAGNAVYFRVLLTLFPMPGTRQSGVICDLETDDRDRALNHADSMFAEQVKFAYETISVHVYEHREQVQPAGTGKSIYLRRIRRYQSEQNETSPGRPETVL
jgi:hypothetical protein